MAWKMEGSFKREGICVYLWLIHSGEAMPLLPWQRSLRGQSDIANCPLSLIQMGRECQTSPWRRPPFRLAGRPLQRTAWNVLLIKAERFNGRISLSTAWNISHSPTILWGTQSLWKGCILREVLKLTKEEKMEW